MTTPTPAALKARLDAKKACESSIKDDSSASRSSQNRDRTAERSNSRTSRPKRSTSSPADKTITSPEGSETTENSRQKATRNSVPSKKDFVLPDHLSQRPLLGNQGLKALKESLERDRTDIRPRRSGKNTVVKNKKENN